MFGGGGAPFKDIEAKLGVVVSLVTGIAKVDNQSGGSIIVERRNESRRCGRCSRCGEEGSEQQSKSDTKMYLDIHAWMQGRSKDDLMGYGGE